MLNPQSRRIIRNAFDAAVSYGVPAALTPNVIEWVKDEQDLPRKKPRLSKSRSKKVSQMKKIALGEINRESGHAQISAAVAKRGGKTHRFRKPAKTGPTKLFKELVHRSLHDIDATGTKTDYEYFYMPNLNLSAQSIGLVDMNAAFTSAQTLGGVPYIDTWMFHPLYFLDAASVMFNNKPASQNNYLVTTANTLGSGREPGFSSEASFGQHARFTVTNSFESWLIKNNTQRTITLKIVLCEPKVNGTMFTNTYDIDTGTYLASGANDAMCGPTFQWARTLLADRDNNLTQNYPEQLKTLPTHTQNFNQLFKTEVKEVVLEPGTTYNYHVEGPKDLEVNFEKYFQGTKMMDIRKYCRAPIFIWHGDILGNTAGYGGLRYGFTNKTTVTGAGTGVYIERKKYCKIQAPLNLIGPIVSALDSSKPQQICFDRPRYFTYVWTPTVVPATSNIEVEPQNPQATAVQN